MLALAAYKSPRTSWFALRPGVDLSENVDIGFDRVSTSGWVLTQAQLPSMRLAVRTRALWCNHLDRPELCKFRSGSNRQDESSQSDCRGRRPQIAFSKETVAVLRPIDSWWERLDSVFEYFQKIRGDRHPVAVD